MLVCHSLVVGNRPSLCLWQEDVQLNPRVELCAIAPWLAELPTRQLRVGCWRFSFTTWSPSGCSCHMLHSKKKQQQHNDVSFLNKSRLLFLCQIGRRMEGGSDAMFLLCTCVCARAQECHSHTRAHTQTPGWSHSLELLGGAAAARAADTQTRWVVNGARLCSAADAGGGVWAQGGRKWCTGGGEELEDRRETQTGAMEDSEPPEDGLLAGLRWNRSARDQAQLKHKIRDLPGLLKHGLHLRKKSVSNSRRPLTVLPYLTVVFKFFFFFLVL